MEWPRNRVAGRLTLAFHRFLSSLRRHAIPVMLQCRVCRNPMTFWHVLPRIVVGYHGCDRDFAVRLVAGQVDANAWKASENDYDWIGEGIYFWEYAPSRAWQWARQRHGGRAAVVAAEVRLGRCLDLADTAFTDLLRESFDGTVKLYKDRGWPLPKNEGRELKLRRLDRLVIDRLTRATDGENSVHFQTVRCPFEEGNPVYPGGMIRSQSHIQIAVRDKACIASRVFLVEATGE